MRSRSDMGLGSRHHHPLDSQQKCKEIGICVKMPSFLLRFVALLLTSGRVTGDVFLLGYLTGSQRRPGDQEYSRPGLSISGAITLAVQEVNTLHPLVGNHTLDFIVAETYGEEAVSINQSVVLWTKNVSAYVGPQETCVYEARIAATLNVPMISYFCTRYETSDKRIFSTFARTRPPDTQISKSVASVLLQFNWKKITFLHSIAKDTGFEDIAKTILKTLEDCGIQVKFRRTWNATYHHGYVENPFKKLVEETYLETRIYVVLGQYYEHVGLMVSLHEKGLLDNGEYFVVGVDVEQYDQEYPGKYLSGLLKDDPDAAAKIAYQSYVGVVGSPTVGFDNFTVKVNTFMESPPFNFPNPLTLFGGMKRIRAEAAYLYDAVHLYATALNETLMTDNEDPFDGKIILKHIIGKTYKSAMGYTVYMDENGDAEGNYTLIARKPTPYAPHEFGLYPVGVFQLNENVSSIPVLRLQSSIQWVGNGPPIDEPPCGFNGKKCVSYTWEITAGLAGSLALILTIVTLIIYRNWRYEQELDSLLWKIDYKDVQINEYTPTNGVGKPIRPIHSLIGTSQVSLSSNPDADFRYSTIYTQIGAYRGRLFAIKKVKKKHIDITRKMKKELKTMRDLRHDNLNAFIGACVDSPHICIITEYCPRGSLKDILENEGVKLDNMFISSLVGDIIRGMIYLHDSPVKSHGNLKTSKCLVDSRWVLKISDFGLLDFKADPDINEHQMDPNKKYEAMLYTAPELLRDPGAPPCGSQKGDVYSFALILYELHGRRGPYGPVDMTPAEIIKQVMNTNEKSIPFRPQLELLENPFDVVRDCLKCCWNEIPEERPDFKTIRHRLRPMRKPNIFDNMIAMMEKYANNLEALVDERTDQLIEEKKKTEALLYEMLPRYVAEQLKHGHKVEAESFEFVTIYFSDIVGFTEISAKSTPMEVVDFLNDLYTCFDSIIENYDVYKVETIGDAYMVVSGLPIRNGDQHAGEIASMSLSLLQAIRKFKIRHRPNDTLMLRIGMHSGPVCAGVVGSKMPRYCLFGDTVNTASRMESTGFPLKIHCSDECKQLLFKLGGYYLEERGLIKIKGKGEMRTYWLVGEDLERKLKKLQLRTARQQALHQLTMNGLSPALLGLNCCPRSSLKNVCNAINRSPVSRTLSLDSPKKLRFAKAEPSAGAVPEDQEPFRDALNLDPGSAAMLEHQGDPCRPLSAKRNSCPCIKNILESSEFDFLHVSGNFENFLNSMPFRGAAGDPPPPAPPGGCFSTSSLFFESRGCDDSVPLLANCRRAPSGDSLEQRPLFAFAVEHVAPSTCIAATSPLLPPTGHLLDVSPEISYIDCDRETPV